MIPMAAVLETSAFVDSIGGDTFLVNSLDPVIVGEPLGKSQIVKVSRSDYTFPVTLVGHET